MTDDQLTRAFQGIIFGFILIIFGFFYLTKKHVKTVVALEERKYSLLSNLFHTGK